MILIADSGSTKTDWCLITNNNTTRTTYNTIGFNPYFINTSEIILALNETLFLHFDPLLVNEIYFYGAGCSTLEKKDIIKAALYGCFKNAKIIYVDHDLLASAKALLGNKKGFAAILGTGTNTCIYNGKDIELNIDSLGYFLGDEGSGCYIGKRILRDYMRGFLPENLEQSFSEQFNITDKGSIYEEIYHSQFPNRYLAGFFKFTVQHQNSEYIKETVKDCFTDFFKNLVCKYPNYDEYQLNCVGSVGYIFKNLLAEVATSFEMELGKIIKSPLESLVDYHLENNN